MASSRLIHLTIWRSIVTCIIRAVFFFTLCLSGFNLSYVFNSAPAYLLLGLFIDSLTPVSQMYNYLPDEHDRLEAYAELIPSSNRSPVAPWCGWVLNLNVQTRIHRDDCDGIVCGDMPITNEGFVGGDLVLAQPGLVIPLMNGDFGAFSSMSNDHFNLDYQSERCSLVFQTDKEFESWREDRHGWESNDFIT